MSNEKTHTIQIPPLQYKVKYDDDGKKKSATWSILNKALEYTRAQKDAFKKILAAAPEKLTTEFLMKISETARRQEEDAAVMIQKTARRYLVRTATTRKSVEAISSLTPAERQPQKKAKGLGLIFNIPALQYIVRTTRKSTNRPWGKKKGKWSLLKNFAPQTWHADLRRGVLNDIADEKSKYGPEPPLAAALWWWRKKKEKEDSTAHAARVALDDAQQVAVDRVPEADGLVRGPGDDLVDVAAGVDGGDETNDEQQQQEREQQEREQREREQREQREQRERERQAQREREQRERELQLQQQQREREQQEAVQVPPLQQQQQQQQQQGPQWPLVRPVSVGSGRDDGIPVVQGTIVSRPAAQHEPLLSPH